MGCLQIRTYKCTQVGDQILKDSGKTALQKTMNADEAFCFGAALYAASLSTAFRLRKFGVHDITRCTHKTQTQHTHDTTTASPRWR